MAGDYKDRAPGTRGRPEGYANRGLDMKLRKCDVRLTTEEDAALNRLAERYGASRSDVMRKALRDFVKFTVEE